MMGLALPRESVGEVKERRKPDRRWLNRETGGGFPQTSGDARAVPLGSTCRGKALRIGKVVPFDEEAAEAVLVPRKCPGSRPGSYGARQGASEVGRQPRAWPKKPGRGGAAGRRCPDLPSPKGEQSRVRIGRSWRRAVKRAPSRGRIAARRSGVARKNPTLGSGKHPAVSAAQAARPEVERSTGARVVSRLQRSVRSIFCATPRGAARQTEVLRSSTERRRALTRRARTLRAKRVRGLSCERNRERGRLRSIARSRSNRRKALWAHGWRRP
jgi:hypothetical protein